MQKDGKKKKSRKVGEMKMVSKSGRGKGNEGEGMEIKKEWKSWKNTVSRGEGRWRRSNN